MYSLYLVSVEFNDRSVRLVPHHGHLDVLTEHRVLTTGYENLPQTHRDAVLFQVHQGSDGAVEVRELVQQNQSTCVKHIVQYTGA